MNKKAFLHQLRLGLKGIPKNDLEDIIYDYQEHIESALETGKSEEQITGELGSPKKIAKQHRAEFYFSQAEEKRTAGSAAKAIIAGIGLSVFNIIFVLPLIVVLYAVLISVFAAFLAVAVSGLAVAVTGIIFLGVLPAIAVVLIGIGLACLGILLMIAMGLLIKVVTIGMVGYFKANIGIVRRTEGL
ncbi:MAG: DUF1700 domain-containing protein [Clostridia bacterium]